jgi:hypothetical protein
MKASAHDFGRISYELSNYAVFGYFIRSPSIFQHVEMLNQLLAVLSFYACILYSRKSLYYQQLRTLLFSKGLLM